jgi:hypothetical protein
MASDHQVGHMLILDRVALTTRVMGLVIIVVIDLKEP